MFLRIPKPVQIAQASIIVSGDSDSSKKVFVRYLGFSASEHGWSEVMVFAQRRATPISRALVNLQCIL